MPGLKKAREANMECLEKAKTGLRQPAATPTGVQAGDWSSHQPHSSPPPPSPAGTSHWLNLARNKEPTSLSGVRTKENRWMEHSKWNPAAHHLYQHFSHFQHNPPSPFNNPPLSNWNRVTLKKVILMLHPTEIPVKSQIGCWVFLCNISTLGSLPQFSTWNMVKIQ